MKKITNFILLLVTTIVVLQSCKKDDSSGAYLSGQGSFTATGGLSLNLTGTYSTFKRVTTSSYDSIYVGGNTTTAIVGLTFVNVKTPTTLPLNTMTSSQTALAAYITGTIATPIYYVSNFATKPGTVTITSISATAIEGSYSTTVKSLSGDSLSFSGTFKGNF